MAEPHTLRVPLRDFANELKRDLPRLIKECPSGIFISDISKEYGESPARIKAAIALLETKHAVTLHQTASATHYIVPTDYNITVSFPELTDLQRDVCLLLLRLHAQYNTDLVRTNYAWLSRQLSCSNGGVKTTIQRLVSLQYIAIIAPSLRGHNDGLLLQLLPSLLDHNLPS